MNNENKVSICIPCLNEGKRLTAILESISLSKHTNLEVIIMDSPKTNDNTQLVLKNFSNLDIRYYQENLRLGQARLDGASKATGKYLLMLDADMQITPDLISECINLINDNASAVNIPEEVIGTGFWTRCKWLEKRCYFYDDATSSPRFFLKDDYFKAGGHNPNLALSEDKDIDLKFKSANLRIVWSKNFLYHNEGKITPLKTFRNKFFWSQTGFEFLKAQPKGAISQILFIFFRKAYFRNLGLLLRHPFLTIGMYVLKSAEVLGAVCGGLGTKIGILKQKNYKTTQ